MRQLIAKTRLWASRRTASSVPILAARSSGTSPRQKKNMHPSCILFHRSLTGIDGRTASISTGVVTSTSQFVKNFDYSNGRYSRTSNTIAYRSSPLIDLHQRKLFVSYSKR